MDSPISWLWDKVLGLVQPAPTKNANQAETPAIPSETQHLVKKYSNQDWIFSEGLVVYEVAASESTTLQKGKVVFSLRQLPLNIQFCAAGPFSETLTRISANLVRINDLEFLIDDRDYLIALQTAAKRAEEDQQPEARQRQEEEARRKVFEAEQCRAAQQQQEQRRQQKERERVAAQRLQKIILVQALVRRWYTRSRVFKPHLKRANVVSELVSTEQAYVTCLQVIVDLFLIPLRLNAESLAITAQQIRTIFSDIEVILNINTLLLRKLEQRTAHWSVDTCIGGIFIEMTDALKAYARFVNNYNVSQATLAEIKRSRPEFTAFLEKTYRHPRCQLLDLSSLLIQPIQRIPRYVMLVNEILRVTPRSHPDFEDLNAAYEKLRQTAEYVDRKKQESDEASAVGRVQEILINANKLPDPLAKPSRRYVHEGDLWLFNTSAKNYAKDKPRERYVFLFNDLVLAAKLQRTRGGRASSNLNAPGTPPVRRMTASSAVFGMVGGVRYKYKTSWPLTAETAVEDLPTVEGSGGRTYYMFQITVTSGAAGPADREQRVVFATGSESEKREWQEALHATIAKARRGSSSAFQLSQ